MSRESVLRQVERMERLADAMHSADKQQQISLEGQLLGTMAGIREQLLAMGLNADNAHLADMWKGKSHKSDIIQLAHATAAWVRSLV